MSTEIQQILQTIKNLLKSNNINYLELAKMLNISHASVKRILNANDVPFSKLVSIANILDLNIFELIENSKNIIEKRSRLTLEQEIVLSEDFVNFLIFRHIILGFKRDKIKSDFTLSDIELDKRLFTLREIKLIEIHPYNKITLNLNFPYEWNDNGPLEKKLTENILLKINKEIRKTGINNKSKNSINSQVNIKEFFLIDEEANLLKQDLEELVKKYETITKLRLKTKQNAKVHTFTSVTGDFSIWD